MSKESNLNAEIREATGKSAVKKVLSAGKIPSIIYGLGENPVNIALDKVTIQKEINIGGFLTRIFSLNIDGKKSLAIPREVQFDPLSDQPIHIDFLRLAEDSKITLDIPTKFINEELFSPEIVLKDIRSLRIFIDFSNNMLSIFDTI